MAKLKRIPTIPEVIRRRRADIIIADGYRSLFFRVVVLILVLFILLTQVFGFHQVSGNEMFPAVKDGDLLLLYRIYSDYAKDDVVRYTAEGEVRLGRIVAREGDVVTITEEGSLQVNGTTQGGEIMYPTYPGETLEYPYVVPEGHVFLLGDYRTQTKDSRDFGPIPLTDLDGKAITILRRRGI